MQCEPGQWRPLQRLRLLFHRLHRGMLDLEQISRPKSDLPRRHVRLQLFAKSKGTVWEFLAEELAEC